MDEAFRTIEPQKIEGNAFEMIADGWMLVTAGTPASWNTMTASWGAMGELWKKKVCFAFVRPQRHTRSFMESSQRFTLSFFDEKYRPALEFCGSHSGRDVDKAAETGLLPFEPMTGAVSFEQASLVIVARKIYTHDLDPSRFLEAGIQDCYPLFDYHRMYIGEVEKVLTR